MSTFGLLGASYGSGSDSDDGALKGTEDTASEDSYFVESESESDDSAAKRRKDSKRRWQDYGEAAAASTEPPGLPDPLSALEAVAGPPSFLDPEATRPLAESVHKGRPARPVAPPVTDAAAPKKGWDIASMAPPVKGTTEAEKRGLPAGAVISAAAKRYKTGEEAAGPQYTLAQIAMMGGQWAPSENAARQEGSGQGPLAAGAAAARGKASKPLPVAEFLDKGLGGAALPRARQDRKDKEKEKRSRGQSSIGEWKTEAEMVLRQQYD